MAEHVAQLPREFALPENARVDSWGIDLAISIPVTSCAGLPVSIHSARSAPIPPPERIPREFIPARYVQSLQFRRLPNQKRSRQA